MNDECSCFGLVIDPDNMDNYVYKDSRHLMLVRSYNGQVYMAGRELGEDNDRKMHTGDKITIVCDLDAINPDGKKGMCSFAINGEVKDENIWPNFLQKWEEHGKEGPIYPVVCCYERHLQAQLIEGSRVKPYDPADDEDAEPTPTPAGPFAVELLPPPDPKALTLPVFRTLTPMHTHNALTHTHRRNRTRVCRKFQRRSVTSVAWFSRPNPASPSLRRLSPSAVRRAILHTFTTRASLPWRGTNSNPQSEEGKPLQWCRRKILGSGSRTALRAPRR